MSPTRFCIVFFGASFVLAAAVAAFNFAVDPYVIFDAPRKSGFNARKPAVATRERMMKAYQAPRIHARTVILGSSRTDAGFDPANAVWPQNSQPVYNLSLVGADTETGLKYLRHMVASRSRSSLPDTLIVGLEFEYFLFRPGAPAGPTLAAANPASQANETDERLALDATGSPNAKRERRILQDKALALLSLDAIVDSVSTMAGSISLKSSDLQTNGHLSETVFRQTVVADGAAALFDQKNRQTVTQFAKPRRVLSEHTDGPLRGMKAVQDMLDFASNHSIAVILSVQPAHVSRLELLDRMGYWEDYERWKRELTNLAASARAKKSNVKVWDFGGYEEYAQEPVPAKQDPHGKMKWFWDPVHYTSALGDVMVARMFGKDEQTDYGVELTPKNVDRRLAQIRHDRADFRARSPLETARLLRVCGDSCSGAARALAASP